MTRFTRFTWGDALPCFLATFCGLGLVLWAHDYDQVTAPPIRAERPAMAAPAPPKVAPKPVSPYESPRPPDAPSYVQGGGVLQVAIGPTSKGLKDCKENLWNILGVYKGKAWQTQMATVKWFGERWTIVFDGVAPEAAEKMCPWLKQLGWGWRDAYCQRMCTYRPDWFASKP